MSRCLYSDRASILALFKIDVDSVVVEETLCLLFEVMLCTVLGFEAIEIRLGKIRTYTVWDVLMGWDVTTDAAGAAGGSARFANLT